MKLGPHEGLTQEGGDSNPRLFPFRSPGLFRAERSRAKPVQGQPALLREFEPLLAAGFLILNNDL